MTTFLKAKKAVVVDYKRRVMLPIFLVCHLKSMMRSIFPFHHFLPCLYLTTLLLLDDILLASVSQSCRNLLTVQLDFSTY